jgi:S1-C subfamily serine protease
MKSFGVVAFVLGSVLGSFLWAGQLSPEEKRALEVKPAVVLVVVELKTRWFVPNQTELAPIEKDYTETGSGFFFRPDGYLITNGHVVADANAKDNQAIQARNDKLRKLWNIELQSGRVTEFYERKQRLSDQLKALLPTSISAWRMEIVDAPQMTVILQNRKSLTPEILQFSPQYNLGGKDVAVLKVPGNNLPTVPLGNSENVRLQDPVMVIGYPGVASNFGGADLLSEESNLEPSATNGHISAQKTENIGTPILQSDVAITHGNSGGPAFNDRGEVIGLATYGVEVAGFNFLVPINTAMEFVRQAGAQPEAGAFNKHWVSALDLYDEGKCNKSIAEFDNVAQFMPGLPDAQKYRGLAVACVDKMGPVEKLTEATGIYPLIAIPLVLVLALVLWLVLSKSGGARSAPAQLGQQNVQPAIVGAAAPAALPGPVAFGRIQFTSGSLSGQTFPIGKEGLWIGRDAGKCRIVLQDDSISSQHAWVVPADGTIVVIDKGSTNGTYVNSVDSPRISKVGLRNGDRVYLGHKGSVFTYFVG